jgi:hypothetical protein
MAAPVSGSTHITSPTTTHQAAKISPCKRFCKKVGKALLNLIKKICECVKALFCCCPKKERPIKSTPLTPQQKLSNIKRMEAQWAELAEKLGKKVDPKNIHFYTGQKNLGNTCYYNAALQVLESCYVRKSQACKELLDQNLSRKEGETVEELEARLLKEWNPLTEQDSVPLKDKALFKWSYLLLLQAKKHGDSAMQVQALRLHHRLCFVLGHHHELKTFSTKQKEAAAYLELWHGMLGVAVAHTDSREANIEGKTVSCKKKAQLGVLQLALPSEGSFVDALHHTFVEHKKNDQGTKFEVEGKSVVPAEYTVYTKLSEPLPGTLLFHLKRFLVNEKQECYKIDKDLPLGFDPKEPLDLSAYVESNRKDLARYELTSVLAHSGTYEGGHYVTYVKGPRKWVCLNDSSAKALNTEEVPFQKAYVLGFTKIAEAN